MVEKVISTVRFIALAQAAIIYLAILRDVTASSAADDVPALAKYFNTKSRYEEVNPHLIDNVLAINESLLEPPAPQCSVSHLSALIRHGTRFPTTKNIARIRSFHHLVLTATGGELHALPELKKWRMWYKEEMDGRLVQKGRDDHKHLAQRLVKSFPSLLTEDNLLSGRVKFITSSKHRCVNSTIAFKKGLMEILDIQGKDFEHTVNDALMRFFDQCRRLVETVENNKEAVEQVTQFNSGPEMRRVQEKLADRLQIPYINITVDSVEAAFYLCAYEFTILGVNSPWCKLFDEIDGQVIEYSSDLKQYWKKGFGHDINSKASCILFHDLFSRLDTAVNEIKSGKPVSEVVTVQVGHAETLLPLLTLLDLFKDNVSLDSSNLVYQCNRLFRSGRIVPYASNLLVALYNCPEGSRVQVRLNERPLTLPGLGDLSPLYQDVRKRYEKLLKGCDQDTVCKMDK